MDPGLFRFLSPAEAGVGCAAGLGQAARDIMPLRSMGISFCFCQFDQKQARRATPIKGVRPGRIGQWPVCSRARVLQGGWVRPGWCVVLFARGSQNVVNPTTRIHHKSTLGLFCADGAQEFSALRVRTPPRPAFVYGDSPAAPSQGAYGRGHTVSYCILYLYTSNFTHLCRPL